MYVYTNKPGASCTSPSNNIGLFGPPYLLLDITPIFATLFTESKPNRPVGWGGGGSVGSDEPPPQRPLSSNWPG